MKDQTMDQAGVWGAKKEENIVEEYFFSFLILYFSTAQPFNERTALSYKY